MAADSNGTTTTRYRIGRGGVTPDKMPTHKDGIISEGVWLNGVSGGRGHGCSAYSSPYHSPPYHPRQQGGSLDSKVLSRDHALIIIDGKADVVSVLDRKSTHGTFVKRRGIEYKVSTHSPFILHTGDVISFGKDVVKGNDRYKASSCRFSRYRPTPKPTTSSFAAASSTTPRTQPFSGPFRSSFSSFASTGHPTGAAAPVLNTPVPPNVARAQTFAWVASHATPAQYTATPNNTTTTATSSSTQGGPRPSGRYGLGRPSSQPHTSSATPRQSTQPNNASQVSPTPPSNDHNLEARTDAQLNRVMASVDSLTAATNAYDKLSAQADKKPAAKDLGRSQSESSASGSSSSSGSNVKDVDVKPTAEEKAKAKMDLDKLTTATTKEAVHLSRLETLLRGKANANVDESGHGETQPDAATAAEPATQPIKHTAAYIRHHAQRQSAARRETDEDEQSQDSEDESQSSSSDGEDEEADEDEEAEHQRQHLKECYSCRKDAADEAAAAGMDKDLSSEDQSDDSIESEDEDDEDDDESDSDDFVERSHNTADGAASPDSIFDGDDAEDDGWDSDASRPPVLNNRRLLGLAVSQGVKYVREHREARQKWLRKHPDHVDSESDSDSDSDSEMDSDDEDAAAAVAKMRERIDSVRAALREGTRLAQGGQSGDKTLAEDISMTLPTSTTSADADESRRSLKRSIDEVEDAGEQEKQLVWPPRVQQVVEVTHAPRADPKAAGIMDESTDTTTTTTSSTSSSSVDSSIAGPATLDTNDNVLPVAISRPLAQLSNPTKRRRLTPRRDIVVGVAAAFAAGAVGTFVGLAAIGAQYA